MTATEYRYPLGPHEVRVIVVDPGTAFGSRGYTLCLPDERWCMGDFADSISAEWLLHEARLPGIPAWRRKLAQCLVTALDEHGRRE